MFTAGVGVGSNSIMCVEFCITVEPYAVYNGVHPAGHQIFDSHIKLSSCLEQWDVSCVRESGALSSQESKSKKKYSCQKVPPRLAPHLWPLLNPLPRLQSWK